MPKDDDGMTAFERASLEIQRAQVLATRENTAALAALKPPDPQAAIAHNDATLEHLRRGGPKHRTWELGGVVMATDGGRDGSGELISRTGLRCVARVEEMSDGAARIIELDHSLEEGREFYDALFLRENAEFAKEAAASPRIGVEFEEKRKRWVSAAVAFRLRIPLIKAIVGKSPAAVAHLVRWDPAQPENAHAATAAE